MIERAIAWHQYTEFIFLTAEISQKQSLALTEPNKLTAVEGVLGAAASGLSGLGFFSGVRKKYKGKQTEGVFQFRQNSLLNLGVIQDNLVNTRMSSRPIPVNTTSSGGRSSGGRSSTHTSSSGRTHGGGGRKF